MSGRVLVCLDTTPYMRDQLNRVAIEAGDQILQLSSPELRRTEHGETLDIPTLVADAVRRAGVEPTAIFTSQESSVVSAAAAADVLGVSRNDTSAVLLTRDKLAMKVTWQQAGLPTATGFALGSDTDPTGLSYPLIVKPAAGFASCGVRRVDFPAELEDQVRKIRLLQATTLRDQARGSQPIVEEYLDGPEFCIDTVWFDGQPIADLLLARTPSRAATGQYFPDRLYETRTGVAPELESALVATAHQAVIELGIRFGPTHTELRLRDGAPCLIEVASRPGAGGLFYELGRAAHGVDFARLAYHSLTAADPTEFRQRIGGLPERRQTPPGQSYFWYNVPYHGHGLLQEIRGLADILQLPEILMAQPVIAPGSHLGEDSDLNSGYFCNLIGQYNEFDPARPIEALLADIDATVYPLFVSEMRN